MSQLITEDIEAIQATRESLDSFNGAYLQIYKRFEELCNKLTLFSPSAITSTEVDKKKAEFEVSVPSPLPLLPSPLPPSPPHPLLSPLSPFIAPFHRTGTTSTVQQLPW